MLHNNIPEGRFNDVQNTNHKQNEMTETSTQNLLLLHAYNETNEAQKEQIALELAKDPSLQADLMEMIRAKRTLNSKMKSPSETSIRIIMEHSHKTEHLQGV